MYRVIQWTTGNLGRRAVRAICEHPELEFVGLYAWGDDKRGRDAGELCGIEETGVIATNDVDALVALGADCVNYNGLLPDFDAMEKFLEAGINIVSATGFMTGKNIAAGVKERLEAAAQKGGASLFSSGINPGWMNMITVALTAVCDRVHSIAMTETADCREYPSPGTWELFGWAKPLGHQEQDLSQNPMTGHFFDGLDVIADALGIDLDERVVEAEYAVAKDDIDLSWMKFPKGTVAGQRTTWSGRVDGRSVIDLTVVWKMGDNIEPNFQGPEGYLVEIEGEPSIRSVIQVEQPRNVSFSREEHRMDLIMIASAMPPIHAIPLVCRAKAGILTNSDLPLMGARHALASSV
ncbi:MAG: dihydrodipicolinate reductase [bacterium]|nr:dihydrodipicolinate reductase [Deltaproteobacteria bacterium]MCP4906218.1 dihydrodipicolinate reductase [bacterium]